MWVWIGIREKPEDRAAFWTTNRLAMESSVRVTKIFLSALWAGLKNMHARVLAIEWEFSDERVSWTALATVDKDIPKPPIQFIFKLFLAGSTWCEIEREMAST